MVQKAVTHLDLANLKNQITEEQMKIRHEQRNEFWEKLFTLDELNSEKKVNNLIMKNMQESIDRIEKMLQDLTKSIPSTYVSKDELLPIKEKQKSHDDTIAWVVRGIVVAFLSLIAWLVWLSKYM